MLTDAETCKNFFNNTKFEGDYNNATIELGLKRIKGIWEIDTTAVAVRAYYTTRKREMVLYEQQQSEKILKETFGEDSIEVLDE